MRLADIIIKNTLAIFCLCKVTFGLNPTLRKWNLNTLKPNNSIDQAITEYFESKTRMMGVGIHLEYSQYWQIYILEYLTDALKRAELMNFEIYTKKSARVTGHKQVFYHNLWYVDSYKGFISLLPDFKNHFAKTTGKYVVVMQTANYLNEENEIQKILEKSFVLNMVDIVVAAYVGNQVFKLYSYEIFQPHKCRKVSIQQVNIFEHGKFQHPELFPYKFKNFHNCPILIYMRRGSISFKFNVTADASKVDYFSGIETNMIRLMGEKLNFSVTLYYSPENKLKEAFTHDTTSGPFGLLNANRVDILMGYYKFSLRYRDFGGSESYMMMPLVVIICEHNAYPFEAKWLYEPFHSLTWCIICLSHALAIALVQFRLWHNSKPVIWLDIIGLALGFARPIHVRSYSMKWTISSCVFGSMIFCSLFQGRLYEAFNRKHDTRPTSIQQLIDLNYTFLLRHNFSKVLLNSLKIPAQQIQLIETFDDNVIYEAMRLNYNNVATVTNYLQYQWYVESNQYHDYFKVVPLVVVVNHICAYMRQHSYLIEPFNQFVISIKRNGILQNWKKQATNFDKTNNIHFRIESHVASVPTPLGFVNLRIVFLGLMGFYLISLLVFLGEILLKFKMLKKH